MQPETYRSAQTADTADSCAFALHAVQVALDRRDNGGDAHPASDQ